MYEWHDDEGPFRGRIVIIGAIVVALAAPGWFVVRSALTEDDNTTTGQTLVFDASESTSLESVASGQSRNALETTDGPARSAAIGTAIDATDSDATLELGPVFDTTGDTAARHGSNLRYPVGCQCRCGRAIDNRGCRHDRRRHHRTNHHRTGDHRTGRVGAADHDDPCGDAGSAGECLPQYRVDREPRRRHRNRRPRQHYRPRQRLHRRPPRRPREPPPRQRLHRRPPRPLHRRPPRRPPRTTTTTTAATTTTTTTTPTDDGTDSRGCRVHLQHAAGRQPDAGRGHLRPRPDHPRGAVPSERAAQQLTELAIANSQFPDLPVDNRLTVNPNVPVGVGLRVLELNSVRFAEGSAEITPDHAAQFDRLAAVMNASPNITVVVVGHADQRGSDATNLVLGQRRADAVVAYLAGLGIDGSRLSARSVGEADLLSAGDDEASLALNRRTEFIIYGLLVAAGTATAQRNDDNGGGLAEPTRYRRAA